MPIDPWASEDALRFFLLKLKEDQELDALVKSNVRDILGHKIAISPSKGRYDEKGKDIVAIKIEKARIERELDGELLLRPIDRWNIKEITNRLYPQGHYF